MDKQTSVILERRSGAVLGIKKRISRQLPSL